MSGLHGHCTRNSGQTRAVPNLEAHPLRFFYDYGIRTTINTDNRLITDTSVTKELWLAHTRCGSRSRCWR